MRVDVTIVVRRDDGTVLSRETRQESQRVFRQGSFIRETRSELRRRVEREVTAALNATLGGQR